MCSYLLYISSAVKIPACFLGSAQDRMAEVRREMLQGKYRVVYITPEFCEVARDMLTDLHNSVGTYNWTIVHLP